MITIYFKNGTTKSVFREIGETLKKRIIDGCGKYQIFTDKNDNLILIINLDEIVYID